MHMDVFELDPERKGPGGKLGTDGFKCGHQGVGLVKAYQTDFTEHPRVGDRCGDILPPEPAVDGDGFAKTLNASVGTAFKAATPCFLVHNSVPRGRQGQTEQGLRAGRLIPKKFLIRIRATKCSGSGMVLSTNDRGDFFRIP